MTYGRRVDVNQTAIVAALRGVGASVLILGGTVDLAVGYRGRTYLLDCKNPRQWSLTPSQRALMDEWRGDRVVLARSADEALAAIGAIDEGGGRS